MRPLVYIRADGNQAIGLGHLVRCQALALMLKNEFDVVFFSVSAPDQFINELQETAITFRLLNGDDEFINLVKKEDLVVIDGYQFDCEYQKRIKETGCKVVCIDDLHNLEFYADLIINHTPGITPTSYNAQYYTQYALGTDYVLLRPSFLKQARIRREISQIETVFICFGGSDYKNLTCSALITALKFSRFKKINVVTGVAFNYLNDLSNILDQDTRITHYHGIRENEILSVMVKSDLAIIPASGILLETLSAGCRVISGMYTDNQKLNYLNYKNAGAFIDAGDFNETALTLAIENSFTHADTVPILIDGKSPERIVKMFRQLLLTDFLKLRKATHSDLAITYKWASDPQVRAYSFNQHQIEEQEHSDWFEAKIKDENCYYFIADLNDEAIGSIRFDVKNSEAIISYLINPVFHGRNLGLVLLKKGVDRIAMLSESRSDIHTVTGFVLKNNIPSLKAFERLGFSKFEETDKFKFQKTIKK